MTSLRRWVFCLIGTTLLHADVIISGSGSSCYPDVACHPPSVQLANLSFPLRRLNVSSTCGEGNSSSSYCIPNYPGMKRCNKNFAVQCNNGEHSAELMLDWTEDDINPHLPTYWQSENTIAKSGQQPTTQYVEVR